MIAPREKLWSTPPEVISQAVAMLQLTANDIVYDIGSGDGRFLFHCAEHCVVKRVVGVEIHRERAESTQRTITARGWSEKCTILHSNALELTYSDATAVFLYLVPRGLRLMLSILKAAVRSGSPLRVVTYMRYITVPKYPSL